MVLTVALVGLFLLRQQQQSLTAEMTKRGLTMAENFAAGAKTPLLTNDELTLGVLVTDAMKDPDVAYVIVSDQDGNVLAHSDARVVKTAVVRPKELEPLKNRVLVQTYKTPQGRIIDFAVPLIYGGVPVGALYLGFSEEAINAALASARNQALLITLLMVLAGLGGAVGLAALLSRPIFRLVQATGAIAAGNFNITLPVASRDELGVLTDSFNRMARSLREKEMIKRAFTRYVAREVVEEILKDPENLVLSGERRQVTVLFCDVRGFTPMSERLAPEEVVLLLNDFYNLMIETTFKYDGTLDKFLGDAVMAVFGAPDGPSRPLRARHPHRARHAGRNYRPQRAPGSRRQGGHLGRHRGQRGRGGGGHGGHRGPDGVHRHRRQREPRGPARVQCQARPDPHQPPHLRAGARPRGRAPAGAHPGQGQGRRGRGLRGARPGAR